jgi:anti-anti-sigma regulatory factor
MNVVLVLEAGGPVVRLSGELDDEVSLLGIVERALTIPSERLLLDLRQATEIDEKGVRGLLGARRLCEHAGVELRVADTKTIRARLDHYGLGTVFEITDLG